MKFTKVDRGWYATADGHYAVVVDGYKPGAMTFVGTDGTLVEFGQGGEWAAVHDPAGELRKFHNAGENLNWFATKREAIAFLDARGPNGLD